MSSIYQKYRTRTANTFYFFAVITLIAAAPASAKDYMVEALVFKNLSPSQATESHNYKTPRVMPSKSSTWALEPSMLLDQSVALDKSGNYQLMHHFSWGQESLPYRTSATYNVAERSVRGAIKVYADNLLFVNLDLDYDGYRMNEKRRLKLNEKHFFDHPKFGILLQVSRLEKPQEVEAQPESQAEPESNEEPVTLESSR